MKGVSTAFKVGLLVMVVVGMGYFLFRSVSERVAGGGAYKLFARFRDASGLVDKSRVVIAGLTVGEIGERKLDGKMARVSVKLRPDVEVFADAIVSKKSSSLLGEFYLEIDPGSPEKVDEQGQVIKNQRLKEGDEIKTVIEATSTQDLINEMGRILPRVQDLAEEVRDLAAEARKVVSGPIAHMAESLDRMVAENSKVVSSFLTKADQIASDIRDITGSGAPQRIIGNVEKASRDLDKLLSTAQSEVSLTGSDLRERIARLDKTLSSVEETAGNAASISKKIDSPDQGTLGRLVNDPTIAENVEQVTEDVKGFTQGLFSLQTIVGLRAEYAFVGQVSRGYLSIEIYTRPDKFYLFEMAVDGRGEVKDEYTVDQNQNLVRYQTVSIPGTRFTAMYGRKFDWLSVRAGLKDSTAGLGVDLNPWGDSATLSVDVFQFTFDKLPRLRMQLAVKLFRYLYIFGGVDDLLNNPEERTITGNDISGDLAKRYYFGVDGYAGIQIKFNDEDLRSLLFVGGAALGAALSK